MTTNTIITIGREFGSAGREIGYKVADAFGIKLYDKEMLARAAKESGICEEIFESHDEKPTNSFPKKKTTGPRCSVCSRLTSGATCSS